MACWRDVVFGFGFGRRHYSVVPLLFCQFSAVNSEGQLPLLFGVRHLHRVKEESCMQYRLIECLLTKEAWNQ